MKRIRYEILSGSTTGTTTYQIPVFLQASVDEMGVMVGFDGDIEQIEQFCNFTYMAGIDPTPSISISTTPNTSIIPSISISATPSVSVTPSISITPSTSIEPEPSLTPSPSDPHLVYFSYSIYGTGGNLTVLDKDDNELLDVHTPDSGSLSISESVLPYSVIGSCLSGSGNKVRFHACNKNGGGEVFTSEDNWPGGITIGESDTYVWDSTPTSVFVELRANDVALNDCPIPLET